MRVRVLVGLLATVTGPGSLACGVTPLQHHRCTGEVVATEEDFGCIEDWTAVGVVRVKGLCGSDDEAVRLLQDPRPGMSLPLGTVVQALSNEAVVKRGGGFDPEHGDWEFFSLQPEPGRTRILSRGKSAFNVAGNCRDCHAHARRHDLLCSAAHECPPPGLRNEHFIWTQWTDPRCGR
jgi:hypothetical protein